jgi:phospholipid/cholesterol/gamma-HCH transport system substrate-binding protein
MSSRYAVETSVGVFVFVALLCVGYLTIQLGDFDFFGADTYRIKARFNSVSGLKVGNEVQIAGVSVGKVELLDDSLAAVKTSGLIGDKYISISPGGVGLPMESGDMIIDTQSPIDVEELVGKYVFGGADDQSK